MAGFLPKRLREICVRTSRRLPGRAASAPSCQRRFVPGGRQISAASPDGAAYDLEGHDQVGEQWVNRVVLSGRIVADPQRDRTKSGVPTTVILLAYETPEEARWPSTATCEVEVVDELADRHRSKLRVGASMIVSGELAGHEGIWAKLISVGDEGLADDFHPGAK